MDITMPVTTNNRIVNNDGWFCPRSPTHQPRMVDFMEFFHGVECDRDTVFARVDLREMEFMMVKRWLANKAHGDPDHNISRGCRPVNCRADSMAMCKKALSFFMVHRTVPWCNGQGNPTKSAPVNDPIKEVQKFEVRGEGAASDAKPPLKQPEFRKALELFKQHTDFCHRCKCPMMALWQFHLIGCVGDVANFKLNDPRGHGDFDFALKTHERWSKNVTEECSCSPQVLPGAVDAVFCLHLNFGIHLEEHLRRHPDSSCLFTDAATAKVPKNLIAQCRNRMEKAVWKNQDFKALETEDDKEGTGTHSCRKFPSNLPVDVAALQMKQRSEGVGRLKVSALMLWLQDCCVLMGPSNTSLWKGLF